MHFFAFGHPDHEIAGKLASRDLPTPALLSAFLEASQTLLPAADAARTRDLGDHLLKLPFDRVYRNYLNHPVRVAATYLPQLAAPRFDDVALALCHNVGEAGLLEGLVEAGFLEARVRAGIATLTTDRARERDAAYLEAYYDSILAAGLMPLKALDKLDNLLEFPAEDFDVAYLAPVADHVAPRVAGTHPHLAAYLAMLVAHVRRPETRLRARQAVPLA